MTLDLFEAAVLAAVRHEDWYPGLAARNLGRLLLLQAAGAVCNGQVSPALAETFIVVLAKYCLNGLVSIVR